MELLFRHREFLPRDSCLTHICTGQGGDNIIYLILLLAAACYFDYRKAKIPNKLIAAGLFLAVIKAAAEGFSSGAVGVVQELLDICTQAIIITAILYPLYMLGVLGAGDVKLCCMCAAFLDRADCPKVFLKALLLAAVVGIAKMLFWGNIRERIIYFLAYAADVVRLGRLKPYWTEENSHLKAEASLRLAGPLLAGVLLYICSKT